LAFTFCAEPDRLPERVSDPADRLGDRVEVGFGHRVRDAVELDDRLGVCTLGYEPLRGCGMFFDRLQRLIHSPGPVLGVAPVVAVLESDVVVPAIALGLRQGRSGLYMLSLTADLLVRPRPVTEVYLPAGPVTF
jgi:hypothetical protein